MNRERKKRVLAAVSFFILAITITACGKPALQTYTPAQPEEPAYNMQYSQSPQEYSLYVSEKIGSLATEIVAQMTNCRLTGTGRYPAEDALDSANAAMESIDEYYADIDIMYPPETYTKKRTEILEAIANYKSTLEGYINALEDGSIGEKYESINDLLLGDWNSLTNLFYLTY